MLSKKKLLTTLKELPEHFSLDELLDRLLLLENIDIGLSQVDQGKTFSTTEAKDNLKKWLS
jgi:hypothetical protein